MNLFDNTYHALVYDLGSAMFRAGFAGSAYPEISVISAGMVKEEGSKEFLIGDDNILSKRLHNEIIPLVDESGLISNPDILSSFLQYTHQRLNEDDPHSMSAIFTQPAHMIVDSDFAKTWRTNIAQTAFETMDYANICITSDALLGAYAHCYHTATVIDFGWSSIRVVPVVEGKPLLGCVRYHICGGMVLSQMLVDRLKSRDIHVLDFSRGKNTKQQSSYIERRTSADILKQTCYFHTGEIEDETENIASINGQLVDVKNDMNFLSGIMWNKLDADQEENGSSDILPLNSLIEDAIYNAPDQYKKALWSNIVTCGGFSTIEGFQAKILDAFKYDKTFNRKVHFPMHEIVAGDFCVWTGGSILSSSPVFDRYLVSKADYADYGEELLKIKCEPSHE
ncbi:Actin family protein [Trichomonas vaginalis G3]|uniref:Actin family protein n=1 Tax=Trichomonas vaginalis (strain ATCC PRA-98 / G3) TaxID=412133 RepID=A2DVJ3_TRIV3|nr:ATP binding [Trichomonas vaginalis G3]EAY15535.1 Actin family protein [Trichomonas vaginalis G3]KAI5526181.1 ATP binding [Trichomonas vaginalis G3]|eukprot:XP_001327758.1 Actin family protein [Trichomonas vaginalis G3]